MGVNTIVCILVIVVLELNKCTGTVSQCFTCPDNAVDLTQCNETVACSQAEICYTMEMITFSAQHTYRAGCMLSTNCAAHSQGRSSESRTNLHCCEQDLCNGQADTLIARTTAWPLTTYRSYTTPCEDHADDCDKSRCGSRYGDAICPETCLKCLTDCNTCPDNAVDLSECWRTMKCSKGQVCYTMEIVSTGNNQTTYRAGCMSKEVCLGKDAGIMVGRRQESHTKLHCCDRDYCNGRDDNALITTTTPAPTTPRSTTPSPCEDYADDCEHGVCGSRYGNAICRKTCHLCS